MQQRIREYLENKLFYFIFSTIFLIYVLSLGTIPFLVPDEAITADAARQMMAHHDWWPGLAEIKAHPPLLSWVQGVFFSGLGVNEFTARLPGVLLFMGTLALTWRIADARYGKTAGIAAGIVFSTMLGGFLLARIALPDAITVFCMMLAFSVFLSDLCERSLKKFALVFAVILAVATLAQGTFAALMLFALYVVKGVLIPEISQNGPAQKSYTKLTAFIALFYLVLWGMNPHIAHEFLPARQIMVAFVFLPWLFFLRRGDAGIDNDARFYTLWVLMLLPPALIQTGTMIPHMILYALPMAALWFSRPLADAWNRVAEDCVRGRIWWLVGLCSVVVAGYISSHFLQSTAAWMIKNSEATDVIIFALGAWGVLLLLMLIGNAEIKTLLIVVAMGMVVVNHATTIGFSKIDAGSVKTIAAELEQSIKEGDRLFTIGRYYPDVGLYTKHDASVVAPENKIVPGNIPLSKFWDLCKAAPNAGVNYFVFVPKTSIASLKIPTDCHFQGVNETNYHELFIVEGRPREQGQP